MIKFLAEKSYNKIDMMTITIMMVFFSYEQFFITVLVAVAGAVISGILWVAYNEQIN